METKEFGARLRQLREKVGLSQSQLAEKIGVNFTYISKIESRAKSPPSKKVILRLAQVFNADEDELMLLAGRVPSDIVEILKSRQNLQSLRSGSTLEKGRTVNKKGCFNIRLKELRKQAGLSQRKLAEKIGVNFTYISKIENGAMSPPSEKVILRLTEVLNADKDELMVLAGKVPVDIIQILKNSEVLKYLKSNSTRKKITPTIKHRELVL